MCLRPYIRILAMLFLLLPISGMEIPGWGQHPNYRDSTRWDIELPVRVPGFRGAVTFGDITIDTDRDGGGGGGFFDQFFDSKLGL